MTGDSSTLPLMIKNSSVLLIHQLMDKARVRGHEETELQDALCDAAGCHRQAERRRWFRRSSAADAM